VGIIGFVIARIYQALGIHKILEILAYPLLYLAASFLGASCHGGRVDPSIFVINADVDYIDIPTGR
jgi:hypothetical protein